MPVFKYFLTVGSLLFGLLYYASSVIEPASLPFAVTQTSGLPKPYKAPAIEPPKPSVAVAEPPKPEIVAAKAESPAPAKNRKAAYKRKPGQVQERYARYLPSEAGSLW